MSLLKLPFPASVRRQVGAALALVLLLFCACERPPTDQGLNFRIVYSGFGINQHPENVKRFDSRGVKSWVEKDLPDEGHIALPEPDQLPKTETERHAAAVAMGQELARLMEERASRTHGRFEVQTIQRSGVLAYALQGAGGRRDLIQWQEMSITAMQVARAALARDRSVRIDAVVGSNDAYTLSKALLSLDTQPFDSITMVNGRAYVADVARMAEKFHIPTALVTNNMDIWAFTDMIANRDGARDALSQSASIRWIDVKGSWKPGDAHLAIMTGDGVVQSATVTDSAGHRELTPSFDAILREAWSALKPAVASVPRTGEMVASKSLGVCLTGGNPGKSQSQVNGWLLNGPSEEWYVLTRPGNSASRDILVPTSEESAEAIAKKVDERARKLGQSQSVPIVVAGDPNSKLFQQTVEALKNQGYDNIVELHTSGLSADDALTATANKMEQTGARVAAIVVDQPGDSGASDDGAGGGARKRKSQSRVQIVSSSEHRKGARPSVKGRHQAGQRRKKKDYGGERADVKGRRRPPNRRPPGWKGPYPPRQPENGNLPPLQSSLPPPTGLTGPGGPSPPVGAPSPVGGIDLSDMSLTYISGRSASPAHGEFGELFRAPFVGAQNNAPTSGVRNRADELRTAFRIGLALPPNRFWVNLNPKQPNRITDPLLARTEVGRILLEADLQLKRDTSTITDPRRSEIGREYWRRLTQLAGGTRVIQQGTRNWITPGVIEVEATGDDAALVYADLEVRSETQYLAGLQGGRAALSKSDKLFAELVLPLLEDRVNNAVEYAALRRVYRSLILARWYRARYGGVAGPQAALIDTERLDGLESRSNWSPTAIWHRYLRSLQHGEYDFTERSEETEGNLRRIHTTQYFSGGVDFTTLAAPTANKIEANLARLAQAAWNPEGATRGSELWFTDANPNRLGMSPMSVPTAPITDAAQTEPSDSQTLLGLFATVLAIGGAVTLHRHLTRSHVANYSRPGVRSPNGRRDRGRGTLPVSGRARRPAPRQARRRDK